MPTFEGWWLTTRLENRSQQNGICPPCLNLEYLWWEIFIFSLFCGWVDFQSLKKKFYYLLFWKSQESGLLTDFWSYDVQGIWSQVVKEIKTQNTLPLLRCSHHFQNTMAVSRSVLVNPWYVYPFIHLFYFEINQF